MDFASIVLQRLQELGLNVNQAEALGGLPQGYIRGVVREDEKRAVPSINKAEEIAAALGMEFYVGPKRETGPVETADLAEDEFAKVPLYDAVLAAGNGCLNDNEQVLEHLAFRSAWLKKIGVAASSAVLAHVKGDSMSPTIQPGDMVLIDTSMRSVGRTKGSRRKFAKPPIFAFVQDGLAMVKRIEKVDSNFYALISDNPDHPIKFVGEGTLESLSIIGKVVWWGHTSTE